MIEAIESVFTIAGVIVTAATLIVAGLEQIAGVTPTTKDDAFVSKAKAALSVASAIFDKVSVWNVKK